MCTGLLALKLLLCLGGAEGALGQINVTAGRVQQQALAPALLSLSLSLSLALALHSPSDSRFFFCGMTPSWATESLRRPGMRILRLSLRASPVGVLLLGSVAAASSSSSPRWPGVGVVRPSEGGVVEVLVVRVSSGACWDWDRPEPNTLRRWDARMGERGGAVCEEGG